MNRLVLVLVGAAAGCSDFAPPSALTHVQIVAVRATPAAIGPGERARLDALVAGPAGVLAPALDWRIATGPAGAVIEHDADGAWLVAAPDAAGDVVLALNADGLAAEKKVRVGTERRDNPRFVELNANGTAFGDELRVPRDTIVVLEAALTVDDAALTADETRLSWFATLGDIELYRRTPTELVVPTEPGTGMLVVVGRDPGGGVTWNVAHIVVE